MVYHIYGRSVFNPCAHGHQAHHVPCIIEISGSDILNFNDYGTESLQFRRTEINMVGVRSQLGIIRQENLCQIAPLPEYVIDMTARIWIPAVLRAETGYLSFVQPFVKLLFSRACSE